MPVLNQGSQAGCLQSTRFYAESATATQSELATDLSQDDGDLTTFFGANQSDNDDRFENSHRTVRVQCTWNDTADGILYHQYANGIVATNREELDASAGDIRVRYATDGSGTHGTVLTIDPSADMGASNNDELFIAWITRENYSAVGASDAVQHMVIVYNVTADSWHRFTASSYALTRGATTRTSFLDNSSATNPYNRDITLCAWDDEVLPAALLDSVHFGGVSAVLTELTERREARPLPRASWTAGDQDEFYGPAILHSANHARRIIRRGFSPMVNENYASPFDIQASDGPFPFLTDNDWYQVPGTSFYAHVGWFRWRPVPPLANCAFVRAHLRVFTNPLTPGAVFPVTARIYSMNGLPGEETDVRFAEERKAVDHGAGVGEWYIEDIVPLAMTPLGDTLLFPAFAIEDDGATPAGGNVSVTINAWSVAPRFRQPSAGALPLGGFNP